MHEAIPPPAARPSPSPPTPGAPTSARPHANGLAAVATIGGPALWVAALSQAPAGTVRGVLLAAGWLGLASFLDRPRRRRNGG